MTGSHVYLVPSIVYYIITAFANCVTKIVVAYFEAIL